MWNQMTDQFRIAPESSPIDDELEHLIVVVPTIRSKQLASFCDSWVKPDLPVRFIFVHDSPEVLDVRKRHSGSERSIHTCWKDIEDGLGKNRSWIIPRKSDCVRSYGFLLAKQNGARYICSMDDDCRPPDLSTKSVREFWISHLNSLHRGMLPTFSTTGDRDRSRPRGIPWPDEERFDHPLPVAINHGLWNGVIDRSGRDEVVLTNGGISPVVQMLDEGTLVVPRGFFYPMCGMNVCFRTEMLPAMYFGIQGNAWDVTTETLKKLDYDRYGDIWAGMVSKLVADDFGLLVTSGSPNVMHLRASNCVTNADKEKRGVELHPKLLRDVFERYTRERGDRSPEFSLHGVAARTMAVVNFLRSVPVSSYDTMEREYLDLWAKGLETWVALSVQWEMSPRSSIFAAAVGG